jgi:6-pyruvoyltetrahydropterin/6-carboxytetrahydropterin synthase
MFEVLVSDHFVATHQLRLTDGTCEALHEHDWHVVVTCAGAALDRAGVLVDFGVLRGHLREVLATLHERNLSEVPSLGTGNPSAEAVAAYIAQQLATRLPAHAKLSCVEVEEEPGCRARFWRDGEPGQPAR